MDAKYMIDTPENQAFLKDIREGLLSFGHAFPSPGGGSYYLSDDGTPWKERPRETWITSRMVHVYSIGALLGHEGSASLVNAGLRGLCGELHDDRNGGWYAGLTADGHILPDKQCYAHAFVILAASSACLAGQSGAEELLSDALKVFDERFWDEEEGLAVDTWDTGFGTLSDYRGLNANMHTVEAFLAVADSAVERGLEGFEKYRERAGRIIRRVLGFARENSYRIPEHYTKDWQPDLEKNREKPDDPFKPYGATPGHGIEWARLITQWALSSFADRSGASPYISEAEKLFMQAIRDGWNADGEPGIVYTTGWDGKPIVHDRMHWTLMEGVNTAAVLYRVTGNPLYAGYYSDFMAYLDKCVLDHVHGSFFHQLDEHNRLKETVWPGKSDIYHALQAMLIPYSDAGTSIASAVHRQA